MSVTATKKTGIFRHNTSLWVEKYRPQTVDEYIGDPDLKQQLRSWIKAGEIPHLLLEGVAGTGKSTAAHILVLNIPCDYIYINASKDNSIETVRTKIYNFCTTTGFENIKIVILDEADRLSAEAQDSLKSIIEQFSKNVRFILTCNTVGRIVEPIRSRLFEIKVVPLSKDQVKTKCLEVLKTEEVDFEDEELTFIINSCYPDIRKTLNTLDNLTINKVLKLNKEFYRLLTYNKKIVSTFKDVTGGNKYEKVNELRQLLSDSRVKSYNDLFRYLYDNIDQYKKVNDNLVPLILILADGQLTDVTAPDKEINMISVLIKIVEQLTA